MATTEAPLTITPLPLPVSTCSFVPKATCLVNGAKLTSTTTCKRTTLACVPLPGETLAGQFNGVCSFTSSATLRMRPSYPLPKTPAAAQLEWLLQVTNDRAGDVSATELAAHYSPEFIEKFQGVDKLRAFLRNFADAFRPIDVTGVETSPSGTVYATLQAKPGLYRQVVRVDDSGRVIDGSLIPFPFGTCDARGAWQEARDALTSTAPSVALLAARVENGSCSAVYGVNTTLDLAIASTFKLYVLAAVERRIRAKAFDWGTGVKLDADIRAWGSGKTFFPQGSSVSVLQLARVMIDESHNLATDYLIRLVGREAVEQEIALAGNTDARNVPLLTTNEMFVLLDKSYDAKAATYAALADVGAKRALLQSLHGTAIPVPNPPFTGLSPKWTSQIEWFASPRDLCRAYTHLQKLGNAQPTDATLLYDVMTANDFVPPMAKYRAAKGGSDDGVASTSSLTQRFDDAWRFSAVIANSTVDPALSKKVGTMFEAFEDLALYAP